MNTFLPVVKRRDADSELRQGRRRTDLQTADELADAPTTLAVPGDL